VVTTSAPDRRRVVLLGASGSIGRQALDVIERFPDRFELTGAVVGHDPSALARLVERHHLTRVAVVEPPAGAEIPGWCGVGVEAACDVAATEEADVVCVGITGAAALLPTLAALDAGHDLAIATKEVLVMAGELVRARAAATGAALLPVDSEHSALWQCLRGEQVDAVARLLLTASGGPFRDRPIDDFATITVEEALRHPTWVMGPKVTIDSATMMNKGLEIIEAHFLFGIPYRRIDVLIHPTSIVHSMVEFVDGATVAQLGTPDMRVPIALALSGGERLPGICGPVRLEQTAGLEFFEVDAARFPAVALARQAGHLGGGAPCVLNAANEAAVAAFLAGGCRYIDIVPLVETALERIERPASPGIDGLLELDATARRLVATMSGVAVKA
jgi:1-deoxy-D-xylulose-5-phosphate reductoisomerase